MTHLLKNRLVEVVKGWKALLSTFILGFALIAYMPQAHAAVPTFTMTVQSLAGTNSKILVTFSEGVSGTSGGSTALNSADFVIGGTDGLSIVTVSHTAGNDYAVLSLDGNVNVGGAGELTIACAAAAIYDENTADACVQGDTDVLGAAIDNTITVTDANISIAGGTGTGGAYIVGDTVTVTWDNSAGGDNNTDPLAALSPVTATLNGFGGGAAAGMTDTTACGGTANDDIYEACYTIAAGNIDNVNVNVSVSAVDALDNSSGLVADTTNATVDNEPPVIVIPGNLTITTDNDVPGQADVGDEVTYNEGTAVADGNTWSVDLTSLTGDAAATNAGSPYTVIIGILDGSIQFTENVVDNAGNRTPGSTVALNVDNFYSPPSQGGNVTPPEDNNDACDPEVDTCPDETPAEEEPATEEAQPTATEDDTTMNDEEAEEMINDVVDMVDQSECGRSMTSNPFGDIASHWAKDYIQALYASCVIDGKTSTSFDPDAYITRCELTKVAVNAFGYDVEPVTEKPFDDVEIDSWCAPYAAAAKKAGIVEGIWENLFAPDMLVDRAQAVTIFVRAGNFGESEAGSPFSDVGEDWYKGYVVRASELDIVDGYGNGKFGPSDHMTRGQAAKVTVETLKNL